MTPRPPAVVVPPFDVDHQESPPMAVIVAIVAVPAVALILALAARMERSLVVRSDRQQP
jgi:hypothetical protein